MNILTKAINEVKHNIPIELLKVAFRNDVRNYDRAPVSIDEMILNDVIRPRVIVDSNLVGGETILVRLDGLTTRTLDMYSVIYEIPPERVNHRTIMSVLSVGYLRGMGYNGFSEGMHGSNAGNNDLLDAASKVGNSYSSIPNVSSANANIVGHNTILLYDQSGITGLYELRCVVANEQNLNNISPRSFIPFSALVLHAVKSYIHNKLIISIDSAYLSGGQELGAIKNIIESYSDAEQNYQTYLSEVWRPTAFMNDVPSYDRFIKMQIPTGL